MGERHATKAPEGSAKPPAAGGNSPNSVGILAVSSHRPHGQARLAENPCMSLRPLVRALASLAVIPAMALATDGGTTSFPRGGEDFLVGAMPPPGLYAVLYTTRYAADGLRVNAITPRIDWVKSVDWLGADRWGTLVVAPYLDIDLALSPTVADRNRGFGDLTLGNGLHWTAGSFQVVNAIDVVAPTGRYDSSRLVSPGRHAWVVRPSHMATCLSDLWDFSYRIHY